MSTTASRTITSPEAWPTLSFDHATAITRTVPANAGMSNDTSAVPSGFTVTTPENSASGGCVGGVAPSEAAAPSPPVRIAPRVPCMPSSNCP